MKILPIVHSLGKYLREVQYRTTCNIYRREENHGLNILNTHSAALKLALAFPDQRAIEPCQIGSVMFASLEYVPRSSSEHVSSWEPGRITF